MRRTSNEAKRQAGRTAPSHLNANELALPAGMPEPAADLSCDALKHFHELCGVLQETDVLAATDSLALSEVSRVYGELAVVRKLIDDTLSKDEPDLSKYSSLGVRRDGLAGLYSKYLRSFGLLPDSRGSVVPAKPKQVETKSRWADFMKEAT